MRSRIAMPVFAVVAMLLSLAFTRVGSAEGPPLYATAGGGTELVAFNLIPGKVRVIGDIGFPKSLALAFCRPGGRPYTIINTFDPANAQLATFDLSTGAATPVGSPLGLSPALGIMGMTCSPNGTLYAVGQMDPSKADFNSLYTIDRETGLASRVGSTGVNVAGGVFNGFFMALAFAPDGTLYGVNNDSLSSSSLYTMDTTTGVATKVVEIDVPFVMGLAIDKDGDFFVADYVAQSRIYAFDVATGVATSILNTGLKQVHNIAFKAPGR